MDRVLVAILVLAVAFIAQYIWQIYRARYLEALLAEIDMPEPTPDKTQLNMRVN